MGSCCAGDAQEGNIKVGKGKGAGAGMGSGPGEIVEDSNDILDYVNERVREIIDKQGEFEPGSWKNDGTKLEERPLCSLENNAKYSG